ncbi:MAG TPA: TetR/AcrR family transcriptional regulator [Devosia sp.]
MSAPDRRQQILDAALASFLERGYVATSIGDIRRLSGASTGSIYHFFEGKGALAEALLSQAVAGWSREAQAALEPGATAERAIKASVSGLLRWGLHNPGHLRFMDEIRTLAAPSNELAKVEAMLAEGQALGEKQYRLFVSRGEVRDLPFAIAHSLMLGPAYNYMRLASRSGVRDPQAPELLAEAAWRAVKT